MTVVHELEPVAAWLGLVVALQSVRSAKNIPMLLAVSAGVKAARGTCHASTSCGTTDPESPLISWRRPPPVTNINGHELLRT